jgi:hypothetical protein
MRPQVLLRGRAPPGRGGGNALIAHGVIDRPTEDVDLFSNEERGVAAAAGAIEAALTEAGFTAERQDKTAGLSDIFYGMGEGPAEWVITRPEAADGVARRTPCAKNAQPMSPIPSAERSRAQSLALSTTSPSWITAPSRSHKRSAAQSRYRSLWAAGADDVGPDDPVPEADDLTGDRGSQSR